MLRGSFSKRLTLLLPCSFLLGAGLSAGQVTDPLVAVRRALQDNLPEVAITQIQELLTAEQLPETAKQALNLALAEAHLRKGQGLDAIAALQGLSGPTAVFWRATAHQRLGQLSEALRWWQAWQPTPGEFAPELAKTGHRNHVSCLVALGKMSAAYELVQKLQPEQPDLVFLQAELLISLKRPSEALAILQKAPVDLSPALRLYLTGKAQLAVGNLDEAAKAFAKSAAEKSALSRPATIGLAKATRAQGLVLDAGRLLVPLIEEGGGFGWTEAALAELLICNEPPIPEIQQKLEAWRQQEKSVLAEHIWLSDIEHRLDESVSAQLALVTGFLDKFPESPFRLRVQLRKVALLIVDGRLPEAQATLDALSAPQLTRPIQNLRNELAASLTFAKEDYSAAAAAFANLAETSEGYVEKLRSAYNSAVASMKNGDQENVLASTAGLLGPDISRETLGSLALEKAMAAAANEDNSEAVDLLKGFLRDYPKHPRTFGGLELLVQLESAQQAWIPLLLAAAETPSQKDSAQRLEIKSLASGSLPAYLAKVDAYLALHPAGSQSAQLLFACGEVCYNKRQLVDAEVRFKRAAALFAPNSKEAAVCSYWAGKAALGTLTQGADDAALAHWQIASTFAGAIRHSARMESARLFQRRNELEKALEALGSILDDTAVPPTAEVRYAVTLLRSELLSTQPKPKPEQLEQAQKACEIVITSPGASVTWKQQASFRKAAILEQLKKPKEALAAYYATMQPPITPQPILNNSDYHWFTRAGARVLAILEADKNWSAAVRVAQQLGTAPGALGEEYRDKAERLKTQHMLWDDDLKELP
jgi:tetratricopeptide (TPR) repeat protein